MLAQIGSDQLTHLGVIFYKNDFIHWFAVKVKIGFQHSASGASTPRPQ
jgi:hypothetical protein